MEPVQRDNHEHEGSVLPHRHLRRTGRFILDDRQRSPLWVWILVIIATLLTIGLIATGATELAIFDVFKPNKVYMEVSHAHLGRFVYAPDDGVIRDIQISIDMVAKRTNTKASVSFSDVGMSVGFQGTELALLKASSFTVPRESSVPLPYNVKSRGAPLDAAGARAMNEVLMTGLLPLDLYGKARTTWKIGIFPKMNFWTSISCRLVFTYPDGNAMPIDPRSCRSWSV